ncbi:hypothetical protein, partial [Bacteroides sp. An269]|uniref:hypothetical protein n=1 Tax=Bacteroides sp. An269 TaxID=1965613 RepID=UPI000B56498E
EVYVNFLFLMSTTAFPCRKDTTFKRIIRISLTFDYNNLTGNAAIWRIEQSLLVMPDVEASVIEEADWQSCVTLETEE